MNALYDTLDSAEAIARVGVDSGATFDKNSSLPMQVITIAMTPRVG